MQGISCNHRNKKQIYDSEKSCHFQVIINYWILPYNVYAEVYTKFLINQLQWMIVHYKAVVENVNVTKNSELFSAEMLHFLVGANLGLVNILFCIKAINYHKRFSQCYSYTK